MDRNKIVEKISQKKRFLIDYANLNEGFFLNQKTLFKNKREIEIFTKNPLNGLPSLIPSNLGYFNYGCDHPNYSLDENFFYNIIFRLKKSIKYEPIKILNSFGNFYAPEVLGVSGKQNINLYKNILKFNKLSKLKIRKINKKYKKVCAFQTRNIPHLGHELLIQKLLERFDHVIVNPVIGPKKTGDVKYKALSTAFEFLIKKKYGHKKLSFVPILANMFYAGPFEAIHHANIRASLGIKYFLIGRDHAGAQNAYRPDAAYKLANKFKQSLKLKPIILKGSYFCHKCDNIIIKGDCNHRNLKNISGTDFRYHLLKKKFFKYADYNMQVRLKKLDGIFIR